jgi:transposase InsO family protein
MGRVRRPISLTATSQPIGLIGCGWLISRIFRSGAGFLYLAVVLDAFSRRIVGWSMATTLHTQVVLDALDMALSQRRPSDVIHHSDQGSLNMTSTGRYVYD